MIQFLIFLFAITSWAKVDLNMGLQGRTVPGIGAELYADSGYNLLLWGRKKRSRDVLYGLIRPSFSLSTSGVINSAKAELEVFPISFLGISAGRQYSYANFDFPFFNCEEISCHGEFTRDWVTSKMAMGAKGYIAIANYTVYTMGAPDHSLPMADWKNVIIGNGGREVQIERKLLLGKVFGKNLLGILLEDVQFEGSREKKESYAAVYQFGKDKTNYMIGAGSFRSTQQPQAFIIYFRIHHVPLASLKLF
jgi:hypothetical protein